MKLNLLSSNEYIDGSGANKPILFTDMDPVIWNGTEFVKVNKTDVYGWLETEVDTHMMKNTEWGAVAYLSKSKYGADTEEVWNNSYNQYKTGCSGSVVNAYNEANCVAYNTENGQKASTTHNIYGVYDMSGGAWEYIMGNYNNLASNSGFTAQELLDIDPKYIDKYHTPTEELLDGYGMNYDKTIYGDGVFETSTNPYRYNGSDWIGNWSGSWNADYSYMPYYSPTHSFLPVVYAR